LNCISAQSPVFIVNIPSATLLILHKGNILLESKVIVGKRSTPHPYPRQFHYRCGFVSLLDSAGKNSDPGAAAHH
jgi:hypothetical protein